MVPQTKKTLQATNHCLCIHESDMTSTRSIMTQEEYNRLDRDFVHCAGTHCGQAGRCLCHTAHKMLGGNARTAYTVANPAVITGSQPCPLFVPDRRETYAWGISHIYDDVRAADLPRVRRRVMACFGYATYYHVRQQRRAITEAEQRDIRRSFTEMGYDGGAVVFDRLEECYPALMRIKRHK